jgi:Zn-dependent protease with chaperone function
MVAGRYFDGVTGRALPAQFAFRPGALVIACAQFTREVAPSELRFTISQRAAPHCIAIGGGGLCEMENSADALALMRALGAAAPVTSRLEAHRGALAGATLALIALMAVAWKWGIPLAADVIVDRAPASWDVRLGNAVLEQLDGNGVFRPSTLAAEQRARIVDRFSRLKRRTDAPAYRIEFRELGVPNAFALPGGAIVVADELLALAPDDDTAAMTVLAHELGHEQYRHGMRGIVRTTLFSAGAAWYLGDISTFAASATAGFTALSYSRDAEHAADEYALAMMHDNALSTHGAAMLFERLADWRPEHKTGGDTAAHRRLDLPEYVSTHPDIRDRIRLFDDGAAASSAKP